MTYKPTAEEMRLMAEMKEHLRNSPLFRPGMHVYAAGPMDDGPVVPGTQSGRKGAETHFGYKTGEELDAMEAEWERITTMTPKGKPPP